MSIIVRRSPLAIVVPVVAGLLAGGAIAFIISSRKASRPDRGPSGNDDSPPAAHDVPAEPAAAPWHLAESERLQGLPARMERAGSDNGRATPPEESFEERRWRTEQNHRALIDQHLASSIDPIWAPEATKTVSESLTAIATGSRFTFGKVECRSSSCSADVTWSSLGDGQEHYRDLLIGNYGDVNCDRQILVPDKQNPSDPVTATLVLSHCAGR